MLYCDTITWYHKQPEDDQGRAYYKAEVLGSVKLEAATGASRRASGEASKSKGYVYIPVPICSGFKGKVGDVVAEGTGTDAESPDALRVAAIDMKRLHGRDHHLEVVLA